METVPITDILLLFNYGHVYHHALESHPALPSWSWAYDRQTFQRRMQIC